ncbi:TPA: restriction endonuclease subunit S [Staphylococcus aureus]|uniref:Restriction endonuclease subunit S n=2 Tax=Staphylococcus aureus TaxID=1280 RepID=Q1KZT5_STAAU|nr:Sau1hsdS1 [Staphylococcus aureus]EGS88995.1 type I restriction modification DNA specificity domain protein [Staphylococcus aureus subsp. aureus 21269]EWC66847.1 restriction endonuclease subunit S [Staphylococcus aureus subsp. aureus ST 1413]EZI08427.1 type I restriction modification DNA specificity domain protein [Staphylococcus aureus subsp. aureus 21337]MBN4918987.1 restriction endonuclease subunit S [Staphylococcus sp. EG-SA-10]VTS35748.1 Type I restriction-modification system, specifici
MSNTQTKNVPELRFPGFEGEWEEKKLEDIIKVNSGKDYKHLDKGDIPVYGTGGYMTSVSEPLSEIDAVGIGRKGTINKPYLLEAPFWTVDTLFYCTPKKETDILFILSLFRKINWKVYDESTGVPSLSKQTINKINRFVPTNKEQQKIGKFFSKLDRQIELEEQKLELFQQQKKGYMQKIFSQELRFKDESGNDYPDWEEKELGEVADRVIRKNKNFESKKPLTISGQLGLIDQTEYFSKSVSSKNLENYTLIKNGEFAYNKSYSNGYPLGAIKRLTRYDSGVLSSLYICFSIKSEMSKDFMEAYFDSTHWYREVSGIAVEGARNHGLLNISVNDFFTILIKYPSLEEQRKIGDFFIKLDRQIELEEQKLELLQQRKKALLKSMLI